MKVVKCINGHYFDNDELKECPVCGEGVDPAFVSLEDEKTEYMFSKKPVSEARSESSTAGRVETSAPAFAETVNRNQETEPYYSREDENSYSRVQAREAETLPPLDKKKILIAVGALIGLLLLIALLASLIKGLNKNKPKDANEGVVTSESEDGAEETLESAEGGYAYKDGDVLRIDADEDEGLILGGYLSSGRTGISFTLPLPKSAENVDVEFKSLKMNIRHVEGGYLFTDEYVSGGYDVLGDEYLEVEAIVTADYYLTVTIMSSEKFDVPNNTPLAITIADMELSFSGK